jgi:hypothetical protein
LKQLLKEKQQVDQDLQAQQVDQDLQAQQVDQSNNLII